MLRKVILFFIVFISLGSAVYSVNTLNCEFRDNACYSGEIALFYGNKNFYDGAGEVISSNVRISADSNYNKFLCCGSPFGDLNSNIVDKSSSCGVGEVDIMYFSDQTNARVGFKMYDALDYTNFIDGNFVKKLCVGIPDEFSKLDLVISDRDYSVAGYSCVYRTSALENGVVSSCNATYDGSKKYKYTVWGRMWESLNSLVCNSDCTSKLDGRIYSACATQINTCRGVPLVCDGALVGSWVENEDRTGEVQCSPPWDVSRSYVFTNESLVVESASDKCLNIVSKKYSVIYDNELVTMNIYVCSE